MSTALKDYFSKSYFDQLSGHLGAVVPGWDGNTFLKKIFTRDFREMELKDRMRHTAKVLGDVLDPHYPTACQQLIGVIERYEQATNPSEKMNVAHLFFPEFISCYGLEDWPVSIRTMERVTRFISCEFAVRPFLLRYPQKTLAQMMKWTRHPHEGVRRLASEGSRPRLPWGMKVPDLIANPDLILPILEKLYQDPSETVRRSVANSLNDIAKDHPERVLHLARKWINQSPETDALVKHSLRTLLKTGHPEALNLYSLKAEGIRLIRFRLLQKKFTIGDSLGFQFKLQNTSEASIPVRLEYRLFLLRNNGSHSPKTYKISERVLKPGEKLYLEKWHSFRPITTMRYYPGKQKVALVVNGLEMDEQEFLIV